MPIPKETKITTDEFFEIISETNEHVELINGEIVYLASPTAVHQRLVLGLGSELKSFIKKKGGKCEPFIAPFDVVLDNENVVQPDVFVVCDPDKVDEKRCNGAPDLVIEIVSTDRSLDFVKKLALYKEFGVREYWIIDPAHSRTLVYFFEKRDSPEIFTFEQPVSVGIYGGELTITVSELI